MVFHLRYIYVETFNVVVTAFAAIADGPEFHAISGASCFQSVR